MQRTQRADASSAPLRLCFLCFLCVLVSFHPTTRFTSVPAASRVFSFGT